MDRLSLQGHRFEIGKFLGAGTFGAVYEAIDHGTGQTVAIKRLVNRDPSALYRFKREFRALADVSHTNLVSLYELFRDEGEWFFSMEMLHGVDLLSYVRRAELASSQVEAFARTEQQSRSRNAATVRASEIRNLATAIPAEAMAAGDQGLSVSSIVPAQLDARDRGSCDLDRLRTCFVQLVRGLHALHQRGLLHCDLKPSNVLVTQDGRVVILDFGLVVHLWAPPGDEREVAGTPQYMAPEQWSGDPLTPATDLYGAGVMLFEALTGSRPHSGSILARMRGRLTPPRALDPTIPAELDALCCALLSVRPEDRPSVHEVMRQLGEEVDHEPAVMGERVFVGRSAEVQALEAALSRVQQGQTVVLHVEGEPGIGKSSLCERFVSQAEAAGAVALRGRCYEQESLPYKALDSVIDALVEHLRTLKVAQRLALIPRRLGALTRVFPVLQEFDEDDEPRDGVVHNPAEARRQAFATLRQLLGVLAGTSTLVVWIDDVHWGDTDSAQILYEMLRPPAAPPLLLLLSHRSDEYAHSPFLRRFATLSRGDEGPGLSTQTQSLAPLDRDDCLALIAALSPTEAAPPERRVAHIIHETAGNPLFIDELVRFAQASTSDRSALTNDERELRLAGVLWQRIDALPDAWQRLIDVVSIAGVPLDSEVARTAAGIDVFDGAQLNRLRVHHLIQVRRHGGAETFIPYHDRVRTTVLSRLDDDQRQKLHRVLAETLIERPETPPRLIATHLHGAGQLQQASAYAVRAAENAERTLAFADAATLYKKALHWWPTPDARARSLQRSYADALVNCGRCSEAAPIYLSLAEEAGHAEEARALRRLAVEQYLTSGMVDDGLELLQRSLADVKLSYPKSDGRALLETATGMLRLKLRGLRYRKRDPQTIDPAVKEQIDTCYLASRNLLLLSPVHSMAFGVRALLLALGAGDASRLVEGFAFVGCSLALTGRTDGERMLEEARKLAEQLATPRLRGVVTLWEGYLHYAAVDWPQALATWERARSLLSKSPGAASELQKAEINAILILQLLGEFHELAARTDQAITQARATGNLYSEVTASLYSAVSTLAADNPEGARQRIRYAVQRSPRSSYTGFSQLKFEVYCDLYEGQATRALDRMTRQWPEIERSKLNSMALFRIVMRSLRAGCALAVGGVSRDRKLLALTRKTVAQLSRERHPYAGGASSLLRAGLAMVDGDQRKAVSACERATAQFEATMRPLDAAYARWFAGKLSAQQALVDKADALMRDKGVARPERWIRCQAPGIFVHLRN